MRTLDGTMTRINDVKKIISSIAYTDRRFRLIDTSGGSASGYSYDLVEQEKRMEDFHNDAGEVVVSEWCWNPVRKIASTLDTSMPAICNKIGGIGAYGPTFNRTELDELFAALRRES